MFSYIKNFFFNDKSVVINTSETKFTSCDKKTNDKIDDNVVKGKNMNSAVLGVYNGSLYLVDGVDFECVFKSCSIEVTPSNVVISNKEENESNDVNSYVFPFTKIYNLRQHMVDAFQFIVKDNKKGAYEYGLQIESSSLACNLRLTFFLHIASQCKIIADIQCAIAEYNTEAKEFVILSKNCYAVILSNTLKDEYLLAIEQRENDGLNTGLNENVKSPYLFIEYLSKDIQIWPSAKTNQFTFWGIHHQKIDINNMMFMVEMDPNVVGQSSINYFFERLAVVLHDRMFLLARIAVKNDQEEEFSPMEDIKEDDGFAVGDLGDEHMKTQWRRKSRWSNNDSYNNEQEDNESQDNLSEDESYIHHSDQDLYTINSDPDSLVHRFMEVGSDRTFVCRGDPRRTYFNTGNKSTIGTNNLQLKVYRKHEGYSGACLETVGTIDCDKFNYNKEFFTPLKGLLHQQESKLLIVPENGNRNCIYMMDLEKEKVVQQWNTDVPKINTIFPTFKKSQNTSDPTFLCTNSNNLFLMDTRLRPNEGKATSYEYSTNPQFTVGTTDSDGNILLGSRLGQLRLYDGTCNSKGSFKRAKTLLETIKEPIIAVDTNSDGSWILVVFPTRLADSHKTGFQVPLGKHKPNPRYLMLRSDDIIRYGISEISFSPAKFDTEEDSIVTSTGNMAVVWDFGTVKRGKPFYSIRFADDTIKDVQITNETSNIVVAYPTAIGLFETEKLKI